MLDEEDPDEWEFNKNLQPVPLPERNYTPEKDSLLTVAGWGFTVSTKYRIRMQKWYITLLSLVYVILRTSFSIKASFEAGHRPMNKNLDRKEWRKSILQSQPTFWVKDW